MTSLSSWVREVALVLVLFTASRLGAAPAADTRRVEDLTA